MGVAKYIILQDPETGREFPVIFSETMAHKNVAEGISRMTRRSDWGPNLWLEPVAAGFVGDEKRGSESLRLGPRPEDAEILRKLVPSMTAA